MNLVDSSGWIEFLIDGPHAAVFAKPIRHAATLLVPTTCLFEVYKFTRRHRGQEDALAVAAQMRKGTLVPLDEALSLLAAEVGLHHGLPFADSVILATAWSHDALLWTTDAHFKGLPGVRYLPKN